MAHFRNEAGANEVQAIFEDSKNTIGISAVSIAEFGIRLSTLGMDADECRSVIRDYKELLDDSISLTEHIATEAISLKMSASPRLPLVDALIAATARVEGAMLVHRDAHYLSLSDRSVKQRLLGAGTKS